MRKGNYQQAADSVNIIRRSANEVVQALSDLVWLVSPTKDSLSASFDKLTQYGAEMCWVRGIRFDSRLMQARVYIGMDQRRHLYLFVKEALNNAVKYSGANTICLESAMEAGDRLRISVTDDGIGFNRAEAVGGNGLANLEMRAQALRGCCRLETAPGQGTRVELELPVMRKESPDG